MHNRDINYVAVGIFVTLMVAVAVASLAIVTGRTGATDAYVTVMDNVADVKFGTQVRFEGYPVGQVERITPFAQGNRMRFRLEISVREGWLIPEGSVTHIGSSGLLSAKTVEIRGGPGEAVLAPGDEIASGPPEDVFTAVRNVATEVSDLSRNSVRPLFAQMSGLMASVGGELETFSARMNRSAGALQRILSKKNTESIIAVIGNVENTSRNFLTLSSELRETKRRIDGLVTHLDAMIRENKGPMRAAAADLQYILRSVAENIDSINHNVDGAARTMNELSRLIRQNPGLLLGGASRPEVSDRSRPADGTAE